MVQWRISYSIPIMISKVNWIGYSVTPNVSNQLPAMIVRWKGRFSRVSSIKLQIPLGTETAIEEQNRSIHITSRCIPYYNFFILRV